MVKELLPDVPVEETRNFEAEGLLMVQLDHPNIVKLLGFVQVSPCKFIIEYMCFGSVWSCIQKKAPRVSAEKQPGIALNIAEVLEYLHNKKILHRDIKSQNILLNNSCV